MEMNLVLVRPTEANTLRAVLAPGLRTCVRAWCEGSPNHLALTIGLGTKIRLKKQRMSNCTFSHFYFLCHSGDVLANVLFSPTSRDSAHNVPVSSRSRGHMFYYHIITIQRTIPFRAFLLDL